MNIKKNKEKIIISIVYLFNILIGVLHILKFASITLVTISVLFTGFAAIFFSLSEMNAKDRKKYYYFLAGIFAFIWMFYQFNQLTKFKILSIDFSNMLFPSIGHIPLFIGLVWITGILISAAFVYTIGMARGDLRLSSLLMGLIMVIYNFLMDPAAQKIGIWNWFDDKISFENYIVWFLFGSIIGFIGFKINLFDKIKSKWLIHLAIAQIIGFSLAQLK